MISKQLKELGICVGSCASILLIVSVTNARGGEHSCVSNWISTGGQKHRLRRVDKELSLEITDAKGSITTPVRYKTRIRPSTDAIEMCLSTWGTSDTPLLVAVTKCRINDTFVYHALFFPQRQGGVIDSTKCFAMTVSTETRDLRIISVNGSFKTDSVIIIIGEFGSVEYLRAIERGVIWMCDCPNARDVSSTTSRFESNEQSATIEME